MGKDGRISSADSNLKAFVVHTDEELIVARETPRLIEDTEKCECQGRATQADGIEGVKHG